jgi:hypothetical protein
MTTIDMVCRHIDRAPDCAELSIDLTRVEVLQLLPLLVKVDSIVALGRAIHAKVADRPAIQAVVIRGPGLAPMTFPRPEAAIAMEPTRGRCA